MAVSKGDRGAYERGRSDRKSALENPVGALLGGVGTPPPEGSKKDAYDKGLSGKQLDSDGGGGNSSGGSSSGNSSGGSGCYITTACVEHAGLPDNCHELRTMRRFRDEFVLSQPEGTALVGDYYRTAPLIVERIRRQKDAKDVFGTLLAFTRKAVALVDAGENTEALGLCKSEFRKLKAEYVEK